MLPVVLPWPAYASGKRYKATEQLEMLRDEKGQFATSEPRPQNGVTGTTNASAKRQANEEGIGKNTVLRNAKFSEGIDVIREHNPDLATAILTDYVMKKSINSVRYLFI